MLYAQDCVDLECKFRDSGLRFVINPDIDLHGFLIRGELGGIDIGRNLRNVYRAIKGSPELKAEAEISVRFRGELYEGFVTDELKKLGVTPERYEIKFVPDAGAKDLGKIIGNMEKESRNIAADIEKTIRDYVRENRYDGKDVINIVDPDIPFKEIHSFCNKTEKINLGIDFSVFRDYNGEKIPVYLPTLNLEFKIDGENVTKNIFFEE